VRSRKILPRCKNALTGREVFVVLLGSRLADFVMGSVCLVGVFECFGGNSPNPKNAKPEKPIDGIEKVGCNRECVPE
jgi:hypothetical protein